MPDEREPDAISTIEEFDLDGDGRIDLVDERHIGPDDPEDSPRDVLPEA